MSCTTLSEMAIGKGFYKKKIENSFYFLRGGEKARVFYFLFKVFENVNISPVPNVVGSEIYIIVAGYPG